MTYLLCLGYYKSRRRKNAFFFLHRSISYSFYGDAYNSGVAVNVHGTIIRTVRGSRTCRRLQQILPSIPWARLRNGYRLLYCYVVLQSHHSLDNLLHGCVFRQHLLSVTMAKLRRQLEH